MTPPTVIYLDVDDEITSAAARIRATGTERIVLVLPTGSRLATSRINFRLLAKEAKSRDRELAIVAPEAGTRSLAASAALPVFATVSEYEAALEAGTAMGAAAPDGGAGASGPSGGPSGGSGARVSSIRDRLAPRDSSGAPGGGGQDQAPIGRLDETRRWDGGTIVTLPRSREELDAWPEPDSDGERGGGRRWLAILVAVAFLFIVVSGVGAYVVLPTAIVTVRAVPEPVGPFSWEITADPLAANVDPVKLVVPADIVTFDLEATDEFPATGVKITEAKAIGILRWTNCDPTSAYTIRAGTRARTAAGIAFETAEAVFLPVATLSGGNPPTLSCQSRDVRAEAVEPGTPGNVPAGTITQVPTNLNSVVIRVSNPSATSGGVRSEAKLITVEDIGKATTALTAEIESRFEELLADPRSAPDGITIIPQTRSASEPEPVEDLVALVDKEADSFRLTYEAVGTVTGVRIADIEALADSLVRAGVAGDRSLVRGSVKVAVGAGRPKGASVVYPVSGEAQQVGTVDAAAVREAIRGRAVGEARERLRDFGDAELDVWPGWVTAIPTLDFRLEIRVIADLPTEPAPTPSPMASPTPTPRRSDSPSPGRSAAPSASAAGSPRASSAPSPSPRPSST